MIRARDVMSRGVAGIEDSVALQEAAAKMYSEMTSSLIVNPSDKDQPFGIITSKDIVNAFAEGRDMKKTKVGDVASTPLIVVTPGVPLVYVARLMRRSDVRHIAVFNGREIVGLVSNIDILRALGNVKRRRSRKKAT